jgi:hypothetical protein
MVRQKVRRRSALGTETSDPGGSQGRLCPSHGDGGYDREPAVCAVLERGTGNDPLVGGFCQFERRSQNALLGVVPRLLRCRRVEAGTRAGVEESGADHRQAL